MPTGPDAIHAPWRLTYLESLADEDAPKPTGATTGCFLSDYWNRPDLDETNHVILRTDVGMILLNRFPYANGHLLVALGDGRQRLLDYTPTQRAQLWMLVELATDLIERTLAPQGLNIGLNQGRAAGAGVPEHLHVHLVPRWGGDVNFMQTVGSVRVIPASLEAMAARFRETLASTP